MRIVTLAVPDDFDAGSIPGATVLSQMNRDPEYRVVLDLSFRGGELYDEFFLDEADATALRTYQKHFPDTYKVHLGEVLGKHSDVSVAITDFVVDKVPSIDLRPNRDSRFYERLYEFFYSIGEDEGVNGDAPWSEIVAAVLA